MDGSGMTDRQQREHTKSMAENFNDMEKISRMLLLLVSSASYIILVLIFLFWMKNRTQEIGILDGGWGKARKRIWMQFLVEALLVGCIGFVLSMGASPFLSKATASYLACQTQEQAEEQAELMRTV